MCLDGRKIALSIFFYASHTHRTFPKFYFPALCLSDHGSLVANAELKLRNAWCDEHCHTPSQPLLNPAIATSDRGQTRPPETEYGVSSDCTGINRNFHFQVEFQPKVKLSCPHLPHNFQKHRRRTEDTVSLQEAPITHTAKEHSKVLPSAAEPSTGILKGEGSVFWALLREQNLNRSTELVLITQLMSRFQTRTGTMDWREIRKCLADFEQSSCFLSDPRWSLAFHLKCTQKNDFNIHFFCPENQNPEWVH